MAQSKHKTHTIKYMCYKCSFVTFVHSPLATLPFFWLSLVMMFEMFFLYEHLLFVWWFKFYLTFKELQMLLGTPNNIYTKRINEIEHLKMHTFCLSNQQPNTNWIKKIELIILIHFNWIICFWMSITTLRSHDNFNRSRFYQSKC